MTNFIHPHHLLVNFPKDCEDEEITFEQYNRTAVEARPTGMAFYFAGVRLAHVRRGMVDALPINTTKLLQLPYETVVNIDNKFNDFLSSLPFLLRSDTVSRERSRTLETVYPMIDIMRYCIMTAVHSRRCRLHQKFVVRVPSDQTCMYSMKVCMDSARMIIQGYKDHGNRFHAPYGISLLCLTCR